MATTFTNKLESFFDNNTPGGYIQTSINITDSELDARINQKFQNQNYLTSTSMIPASQITGLAEVATSGRYSDLIGITGTNVSISNTLTEGTRLATITINGESTDLYTPITEDGNIIITETDPVFLASPAATITNDNITNWNNKSNFNGDYNNLINAPALPLENENSSVYDIINEGQENEQHIIKSFKSVAFTNDYNELINRPDFFDYIHVNGGEEEFYNIPLFGRPNSAFIDDSDLGLRIYNSFINNKIVIIISYYGIWLVTNCMTDTNETTGNLSTIHYSIINIFDNYNTIIDENLPVQEDDELDDDYENRCDNTILNNLNYFVYYGTLIYNIDKGKLYCKFSNI